MASIILVNTGEKLGENLMGGFFAPTIWRYFGSFLGSAIDKQLFRMIPVLQGFHISITKVQHTVM